MQETAQKPAPWISIEQQTTSINNNLNLDPVKLFTKSIRNAIFQKNQKMWSKVSTNKLRLIKPIAGVWNTANRSNRKEEVILARLRLGHCSFSHLELITKKNAAYCEICSTPRTVNHVMTQCHAYSDTRRKFFGPNPQLGQMLSDSEEAVHTLFQFLREANLWSSV